VLGFGYPISIDLERFFAEEALWSKIKEWTFYFLWREKELTISCESLNIISKGSIQVWVESSRLIVGSIWSIGGAVEPVLLFDSLSSCLRMRELWFWDMAFKISWIFPCRCSGLETPDVWRVGTVSFVPNFIVDEDGSGKPRIGWKPSSRRMSTEKAGPNEITVTVKQKKKQPVRPKHHLRFRPAPFSIWVLRDSMPRSRKVLTSWDLEAASCWLAKGEGHPCYYQVTCDEFVDWHFRKVSKFRRHQCVSLHGVLK